MKEENFDNTDQHYLKKELYELLKTDNLMFEFLQEGALDGLWYWDLTDPEHEWMSPQFWKLFGYNPDEMQHRVSEWQDIIYKEDLDIARKNFELHMKDPKFLYDQVVRYYHKNGSTVWVRCRGMAIHDSSGNPVRLLGAHVDLTPVMEKQKEIIGLRLQHGQLTRQLNSLKYKYAIQEQQLSYAQSEIEQNQMHNKEGFYNHDIFLMEIRKMFALAKRLTTTISIFDVVLRNAKYLETNFGSQSILEKQINAVSHFTKLVPDNLSYAYDTDRYWFVTIGIDAENCLELKEQFEESLHTVKSSLFPDTWEVTYKILPSNMIDEISENITVDNIINLCI